jgi:protein-tyrosine phosphatase
MTTDPPPPPADALHVLVVCTANRCRSPVAEVLLWRALVMHDVRAIVLSAGLLEGGRPADETTRAVMAQRGIDLGAHRSEQVTTAELRDADLVLTMERRHARELILLAGPQLPVHTLRAFAPLASGLAAGPRGIEWLRAVCAARPLDAFVGDGRADEIDDPIGRPANAHRECVDQIALACDEVAAVIAAHWP